MSKSSLLLSFLILICFITFCICLCVVNLAGMITYLTVLLKHTGTAVLCGRV